MNIHKHDLHRVMQSTKRMLQSSESFVETLLVKCAGDEEEDEEHEHTNLKRPPSGRGLIKPK